MNLKQVTDYDEFIYELIKWLLQSDKYNVFSVAHVGDDGNSWAMSKFGQSIQYCGPFNDPISAKNMISSFDIFLGSRMHATIAAFSSGVYTIPIAYSRKFKGVFDVYRYEYLIDLESMTTDQALNKAKELIHSYDIANGINVSNDKINNLNKKNYDLIKNAILEDYQERDF